MADDIIAERFGEPSDVTVVPFVDREDGIGFRGGGFSLHRNCGGMGRRDAGPGSGELQNLVQLSAKECKRVQRHGFQGGRNVWPGSSSNSGDGGGSGLDSCWMAWMLTTKARQVYELSGVFILCFVFSDRSKTIFNHEDILATGRVGFFLVEWTSY